LSIQPAILPAWDSEKSHAKNGLLTVEEMARRITTAAYLQNERGAFGLDAFRVHGILAGTYGENFKA
jgi:hypothetical protein